MTVNPSDGFLFEYVRPEPNSPGGVLRTQFITVAPSLERALVTVGELVPNGSALRLTEQGPTVLRRAEILGLRDGEAKAL